VFNLGSKAFFAISGFLFLVTVVYWLNATDNAGSVLLFVASMAAAGIAMAALAGTGGADRFALSKSDHAAVDAPTAAPLFAALALGFVGLSLALGASALAAGLIVGVVGCIAWFSNSWRSHPDIVGSMQPRISDRFSLPFGMPLAALGVIAIVAISVSRSLLSTSPTGSWVLAAIIGVVVFAGLIVWAWKPDSRGLRQFLIIATVISVVVLAVVGLAAGERKFGEEGGKEAALSMQV
jgi:hypothetical protein